MHSHERNGNLGYCLGCMRGDRGKEEESNELLGHVQRIQFGILAVILLSTYLNRLRSNTEIASSEPNIRYGLPWGVS